MTDVAFEQKIRERAYEIWMASGCENGLADLHWLSAEEAVRNEAAQPCAKVVAPKSALKGTTRSRAAKAAPTVTVRKRAKGKADAHA